MKSRVAYERLSALARHEGHRKSLHRPPYYLHKWWARKRNDTPRRTRILETLKIGFSISRKARRWSSDFKWLFDLRDAALHHGPEFRESVPHPLGVNVTREYVDYSVESAERAVELMLDVLSTCAKTPPAVLDR
jgi:hypothetical protein